MANPIFEMFGKKQTQSPNNVADMMNQFNQFKNTFSGDPKQQVMNLLQSGKMTQDQLNQLQQMAGPLYKMMGGK